MIGILVARALAGIDEQVLAKSLREKSGFGLRPSLLHLTRIFNPNGIVSISPGLRGTSYPGWADGKPANPNGVAPHVHLTSHNPVGVEFSFTRGSPRVAHSSQPLLGLTMESLWDSHLEFPSPTMGVSSSVLGRSNVKISGTLEKSTPPLQSEFSNWP